MDNMGFANDNKYKKVVLLFIFVSSICQVYSTLGSYTSAPLIMDHYGVRN
jgi:hypothetical protein